MEDIHAEFYGHAADGTRDVKAIIRSRREKVLEGVTIVFSGVIPRGLRAESFELWRLSEMFGATCSHEIAGATHLVTIRNDTDKVLQAMEAGLHIINPQWLLDSLKFWKKMDETPYAIMNLPKKRRRRESTSEELISDDALLFDPEDLQSMEEELRQIEDSSSSDDDEEVNTEEDFSFKRRRTNSSDSHQDDNEDDDLSDLERELFS